MGEPSSSKTVDLSQDEAKEWQGKWDVIITYPNNKDASPREKAEKMQARRDKLIRRMRKCGLVVVRQISTDETFVMLKITAPLPRLEQEAGRLDINLPLKTEAQASEQRGAFAKAKHYFFGKKPLEQCYARFDAEMKDIFSTLDKRFFRSMDRQRLILSIMETTKWRGGCAIDLNKEIRDKTFTDVVVIHTRRGQQRMVEQWLVKPWLNLTQPLETIRDYFGEKVAFYFAFIALYTKWLVYLSILGVITFIVCWLGNGDPTNLNLDHDINIFYGIALCLWSSLFLENWKRQQASLAFKFDCVNFAHTTEARPEFKGDLVKGRITPNGLIKYEDMADITPEQLDKIHEYVLWFPPTKRALRYVVGSPIVTTFAVVVVVGTFALLAFKTFLSDSKTAGGGVIGSIANAVFIIVMNVVYQWIAVKLNNFENHRTDLEYENALIAKTFIFQFINSYIALFFIAFIKGSPVPSWAEDYQNGTSIERDDLPKEFRDSGKVGGYRIGTCEQSSCMLDLFFQLATIVIVKQLLSNFAEVGWPWLQSKITVLQKISSASKKRAKAAQNRLTGGSGSAVEPKELTDDLAARMPFFEEQVLMSKSQGTFAEYNELMIQFGYMTLFATSFPLASLFSLLNNVVEIRVDATKILFATQRPVYEGAADIGTWLSVLEFMNFFAVMTNAAIICFTSTALRGSWTNRTEADYITCATACTQDFNSAASSWASYLANSTNPDQWLVAGVAREDLLDANSCLLDCACDGRCLSSTTRFLIFIVAEHLILFLKLALDYFIPDVPKNIARAMVWKDLVGSTVKAELERAKAGVTDFADWNTDNDSADDKDFVDDEQEDPAKKITIKVSLLQGKVEFVQGGHRTRMGATSSKV